MDDFRNEKRAREALAKLPLSTARSLEDEALAGRGALFPFVADGKLPNCTCEPISTVSGGELAQLVGAKSCILALQMSVPPHVDGHIGVYCRCSPLVCRVVPLHLSSPSI